jgi:hypothetical protein
VTKAIVTRRIDGTDEKVVFAGGNVFWSIWASGGRILFARGLPPPLARYQELWQVSVDERAGQATGPPTRVWLPTEMSFYQPSLTADGKRLAYISRHPLSEINVADFDPSAATLGPPSPAVPRIDTFGPETWTPSGELVFGAGGIAFPHWYRQAIGKNSVPLTDMEGIIDAISTSDANSVVLLSLVQTSPANVGKPFVATVMRGSTTGSAPVRLFEVPYPTSIRCARTADACVVGERVGDRLQATRFSPTSGQRDSPVSIDDPADTVWDLSPDGQTLVSLHPTKGRIEIVLTTLANRDVRRIPCDGCTLATCVAWVSPGSWVVTRDLNQALSPSGEILYVDASGQTKSLWKSTFERAVLPAVSPDGKRLAFGKISLRASVWMLTGF